MCCATISAQAAPGGQQMQQRHTRAAAPAAASNARECCLCPHHVGNKLRIRRQRLPALGVAPDSGGQQKRQWRLLWQRHS